MPSFAGFFLIARPVLRDSNFRQSVVLILQHTPEGAFGLVVNRPAKVTGLPFPVFVGGPCEAQGLLMLHGHSDWLDDSEDSTNAELAPGVFLGDASCLTRATATSEDKEIHFRVFRGYAGWGPEQLEGEIASGAWVLVPASGQVLWETAPENLWIHLLPPMIPQPSQN